MHMPLRTTNAGGTKPYGNEMPSGEFANGAPGGQRQGQAAVEGEITLPGGLREEARVLSAGAMVVLENVEAQQDKVILEGRVVFHALYTQGDPDKPQAMEASADFTHTLDLPGAQARMLCRGDAAVEHVEATAYSGRLGLRAILQTRCRVLSTQPVAALTGITGVGRAGAAHLHPFPEAHGGPGPGGSPAPGGIRPARGAADYANPVWHGHPPG